MNFRPLERSFFEPSASVVAPLLLGHRLIRNTTDGPCGGAIVETEAYLIDDPACHGFGGETPRNRSMWGPPGRAYVYFIYGMHYCVNAVCRPQSFAEAVLIRAVAVEFGEATMRLRRGGPVTHQLTSGPARLCKALEIDRRLDGVDLCDPESPLFIAENPGATEFARTHGPVRITPRIGITQAAGLPLRFVLAGSPFVSRRIREVSR